MRKAQAVFLLPCNNDTSAADADNKTILRSWAIRESAPHVPQYVHLTLPENEANLGDCNGRPHHELGISIACTQRARICDCL